MEEKYTCSMHPEVVKESPGRCPECGMELIPLKAGSSRAPDKHEGHSTEKFLKMFWVSLAMTVPVVLYADIVEHLFVWSPPAFPGSEYMPAILGTAVFLYGGRIFLSGALKELRARMPGMMTLIGIAISAAYLWSVYAVFAGLETLFWELTTLITVMLLGHWIEMRAVKGARGALKELSKLLPDTAEVVREGKVEKVPLKNLKEGDLVLVRPGSGIPADGKITEGHSEIDESMVTGESRPVSKDEGDEVVAGTINGDGSLKVTVSKIGDKTFLAGVMRLVEEAERSKSRLQTLSDRAAFYLTVVAVVGGTVTLFAWLLAGADVAFAVARLVAVLVIACPHALGLAVPLVASISTTKAANNGFLIKRRIALEAAREVDVVLFDKTGTLTRGEFGVMGIKSVFGTEEDVLRLAASINLSSEHPIAKAMVTEAEKRSITLEKAEQFEAIKGKGAKAMIGGSEVMIGGPALIEDLGIKNELEDHAREAGQKGHTVVFTVVDGKVSGAISLADMIRDESKEAVRALSDMGIKSYMVTGDSEDAARWVSREIGIEEYFAGVLPDRKSEKVKELQVRGLKVAMIGDGINDAPALARSDLGVAVGAGTNVAIESAGIILVRNDPRDIVKIIKLSRMTYSKMIQNLFWATGYNIAALPLAAGVLVSKGIILQPAVAAVFMSVSTVIVAINALLLRRKDL